ncbi:MAG: ribonuclease domain-containing protein [Thermodesulfobacteriota bacterium]
MRRELFIAAVLLVGIGSALWAPDFRQSTGTGITQAHADARGRSGVEAVSVNALPPEARETLTLIKKGGPFPYPKDGTVFGNREKRLPPKPRGYYKEYTVKTPGGHTRGARRIVAGQGGECYYTDDHYVTFRLIRE